MPAKTPPQYGLMSGVCHGSLKSTGVPKSVACEFVHKTPPDKRSRFSKALAKRRKKR